MINTCRTYSVVAYYLNLDQTFLSFSGIYAHMRPWTWPALLRAIECTVRCHVILLPGLIVSQGTKFMVFPNCLKCVRVYISLDMSPRGQWAHPVDVLRWHPLFRVLGICDRWCQFKIIIFWFKLDWKLYQWTRHLETKRTISNIRNSCYKSGSSYFTARVGYKH